MTENEAKWEYCRAIDIIKRIKTEETHERYVDRHKAFELAIKALEKEVPKKPIRDKEFSSLFECPACGRRQKIMYELYHCKECGQKLDWQ